LAALFLFAGSMKLVLPLEDLAGPIALPGPLLRFIGTAEVVGAIGLVLPWLLRIEPVLTPVAAGGLLIIMAGAVVLTVLAGSLVGAILPLVVAAALVGVAHGRARALAI
jgi:hypothetical protein